MYSSDWARWDIAILLWRKRIVFECLTAAKNPVIIFLHNVYFGVRNKKNCMNKGCFSLSIFCALRRINDIPNKLLPNSFCFNYNNHIIEYSSFTLFPLSLNGVSCSVRSGFGIIRTSRTQHGFLLIKNRKITASLTANIDIDKKGFPVMMIICFV